MEEIKGLVYIAYKTIYNDISNTDRNNFDKNKIIEFVLAKIAPCFNEKIMTLISNFGFKNKFNYYYDHIYHFYKCNYSYNFINYL